MAKRRKCWCALMCMALLSGCALLPAEEEGRSIALVAEQQAPNYVVEEVQYRDLQNTEMLYATYTRLGNEDYYFGVSGVVEQIYVNEGDEVAQGQILACLNTYEAAKADADQYTAEIERLSVEQEQLQVEMDFKKRRIDIAYRYGELTEQEYEREMNDIAKKYDIPFQEMTDALYIDQLRLEAAKKIMEESAIFADRDGTVTYAMKKNSYSQDSVKAFIQQYGQEEAWEQMELMGNRSNTVASDTVIVSLADMEECAFVCETEYADRFHIGDSIKFSVGTRTGCPMVVTDAADGVVCFQPEQMDQIFEVGVVARATLVLDGSENVLSISTTSLHEMEDGYYVYCVDEAGLRQMRTVEVGVIGNAYTEITGGLEPGDLVIKR